MGLEPTFLVTMLCVVTLGDASRLVGTQIVFKQPSVERRNEVFNLYGIGVSGTGVARLATKNQEAIL